MIVIPKKVADRFTKEVGRFQTILTKHCKASISVNGGNLLYVLVEERSVFDAIDLPVAEGKCLSKTLEQPGGIWIIFQFWGDR